MKLAALCLGAALALRPHGSTATVALVEETASAAEVALPVNFGYFDLPENPVVADPNDKGRPISVAMRCVIAMCMQFFLILTAVSVGKTVQQWTGSKPSGFLIALQCSRATLVFVPMLCVFFLSMRLLFVLYGKGNPEKYGMPSSWMAWGMSTATSVIMFQALLVLVKPCIGQTPDTDEDGNIALSGGDDDGIGKKVLGWTRLILLVGLWASITALLYGCFTLEAPKSLWPNGINVPPAIMVTANLTQMYFFVYAVLALLKEFGGPSQDSSIGILQVAIQSLQLAPMMCVLCIAARMRSITLGRENPQWYAMFFMKWIGWGMVLQVACVLVCGFAMGGKVAKGTCEGDVSITVENKTLQKALDITRTVLLFGIYAGVVVILYSLMTLTAAKGPTPPLYPATRCVSVLTQLYFTVYLGLYIIQLARGYMGATWGATALKAFDAARGTIFFAPMLSVLFLGVRLRAMQNNRNPQGYVQDCMYLCTHVVVIQMLMCLIMGFMSSDVQTDEDGNVKTAASQAGAARAIFEGIRYTSLACMYGGACGIVYGAAVMTKGPQPGDDKLFGSFNVFPPLNPFRIFSVAGFPVANDASEPK